MTRGTQRSVPIGLTGEVKCPFCNRTIKFEWDKNGRLIYWAPKNACSHFKGVYAGVKENYALFEGEGITQKRKRINRSRVLIKHDLNNGFLVYWGFSVNRMYPINRLNVIVYIPFKKHPNVLLERHDDKIRVYKFISYKNGVLTIKQLNNAQQDKYNVIYEGGRK